MNNHRWDCTLCPNASMYPGHAYRAPRTAPAPREVKWVIIYRVAGVDFTSEPIPAHVLAETTYQMQEAGLTFRTARA